MCPENLVLRAPGTASFCRRLAIASALMAAACASESGSPAGPSGPGDPAVSGTGSTGGTDGTDGTQGGSSGGDGAVSLENPTYTWHRDVSPLAQGNCVTCHRDGGIAPFSLEEYETAKPWAAAMASAVASGRMPPTSISTEDCDAPHGYLEDLRLSEAQKEVFQVWADEGAPEGDPNDAIAAEQPTIVALEDVSYSVTISSPVTVSGIEDQFYCFSLDPGTTEDRWMDALQVNPGNEKIVHHVLIYEDSAGASAAMAGASGRYPCFGGIGVTGSLIGAWAPGGAPIRTPEGVAMRVAAGARLVMQVHYHPVGPEETDSSTSIDIHFRDTAPEWQASMHLLGNARTEARGLLPSEDDPASGPAFLIPAGAESHTETSLVGVDRQLPDVRIWSIGNHMHYVGDDMKTTLVRASPQAGELEEQCLLHTPDWDFNWQRVHRFDTPIEDAVRFSTGDKFRLECTYNNTLDNPAVATALAGQGKTEPEDVVIGDTTLDEMCLTIVGAAYRLAP